MTPKQIVDYAHERGMFSDKLSGITPDQTMNAKLSTHVRRLGHESVFVRTKPGHFYLRSLMVDPADIYEAKPLQAPVSREKVLTFPPSLLDEYGRFQGINQSWKRLGKALLTPAVCQFRSRPEVENDDRFKQVVTYVMVTRREQILAFKRGSYNRIESFLRGCQCIGFGGHVSEADWTLFDAEHFGLLQCAARELREELALPDKDMDRLRRLEGVKIVGLLNDDSSEVGRRHLAVVMRYEVSDAPAWDRPVKGEKSITQLRWLDPSSPDFSLWDFEYWSQLCLRSYFPALVRTRPTYYIRRIAPLRPPHLLCVLGEVGSGKSEATRILKEEFGYVEINSGRVLAHLLGIGPVPETPRRTFQQAALEFISKPDGPSRLAQAIWQRVASQKFPRYLVDGIRQPATLRELRRLAGRAHIGVLYVHTPPDVAFEFYAKRTRETSNIHDFLAIRENPVEQQVSGMIGLGDAIIYNWTGRPSFRNEIVRLMRDIEKSGR